MDPDVSDLTPDLTSELLRLASADNFRDVAGTGAGYPTVDGGHVQRGVLYRSNELQLSDEDARAIADLGVTSVFDLRNDHELEAWPDVPVPGATWHHVDVLGIPAGALSEVTTSDEARALMQEVYRGFVDDPGTRQALGRLFSGLAGDGVHLFHCQAGKDRTGWTAALLLHLAGVADDVIDEDYLLTNEYAAASQAATRRLIVDRLGEDRLEVYGPVLGAQVEFLHAAYDAVDLLYGTRERYLSLGLGLDDAVLQALRDKLRPRG